MNANSWTSIALPRRAPARVLACGAWLKNTACLIDGERALLSPLHGDLGEPAACIALAESIGALMAEAGGRVAAVAHDLHPDFHSTRMAQQLAADLGVPAIGVQHHHAHLAVVLAEAGLAAPVIGLALDGVGLGDDGSAWGGELLRADAAQCERLDHLAPLALPGGDVAAREPWRMAAAALHASGHGAQIVARLAPAVGETAARTVQAMLERGVNCPPTTAAGRWFDAAAGALGLSVRQRAEAEAAVELERAAADWLAAHPGFDAPQASLDLRPPVHELWSLRADPGRGAALFHRALGHALVGAAGDAARRHGLDTVVLGGGCFFNRLLSRQVADSLEAAGLRVLRPKQVSCGDAGLALGQAWVAAHRIGS